jgi:hypothetical protein
VQQLHGACEQALAETATYRAAAVRERTAEISPRGPRKEQTMKEVLTKKFWQGVKKTFDEAREGPPSEITAAPPPVEASPDAPAPPEPPPSPSAPSEPDLTS